MIRSTGTLASPKASQYLQQLCKHLLDKVGGPTRAASPCEAARQPRLPTAASLTATVTAPDLAALPHPRPGM